jgi:AsmA protein
MQALGSANADVSVTIGKLILSKMTLDNVAAKVKLQNGVLNADVDPLKLFSGTVKLAVSAQQAGAAGIKATMTNVQTEELLSTLAGSHVMQGVLHGNIDLTVRGNSQRAFVSSLAGTGAFNLVDGSYRGGNLLDMTRNVATSFQRGTNEAGKTDFKELSGTFNAKDGVIFNNDLKMAGTLLSLTGNGQIDLPQWLVHFLLTPVVVTNRGSETQGISGISVPVKIEGSLDAPSYHPDLRGALEEGLKDPEKLKENLKNIKDIKKNLNKETLQNLLR